MGGLLARRGGFGRDARGIARTNLGHNLCRHEPIVRLELGTWNRPSAAQPA